MSSFSTLCDPGARSDDLVLLRTELDAICSQTEQSAQTPPGSGAYRVSIDEDVVALAHAVTATPSFGRYSLPAGSIDQIRAVASKAEVSAGPLLRATLLRRLFVELLLTLRERLSQASLPHCLQTLTHREAARITADLRALPPDFFHPDNDLFIKDLAILALTLLPCGAELAQVRAGIPRSLLIRAGMAQLFRGLRFFSVCTKGFQPFLSLHMDVRNLAEFNPLGWDQTYLRLASLLRTRPELKGVFGTAWFYDPAIESISPHLAYLRKRRVDNGAVGFSFGPTESATRNALARSNKRRQLFETGLFRPQSYYLVWPRQALLDWADQWNSISAGAPEPET